MLVDELPLIEQAYPRVVGLQLHEGGEMITILHWGRGGGSLGTPKSDYVICARPHTSNKANSKNASKTSESVNQLSSYSLCVFYVFFTYVCKQFVMKNYFTYSRE